MSTSMPYFDKLLTGLQENPPARPQLPTFDEIIALGIQDSDEAESADPGHVHLPRHARRG